MILETLSTLVAFLLGSIPFGLVIARLAGGVDIRKVGSGNIGATNVFRQSRWAGLLTLALDCGKGYLAVVVARRLGLGPAWQAFGAVAAIAGHVFTPWLGFKGGKGVATGAGAYAALAPVPLGVALAGFVVAVVWSRYISLGSIAASLLFPLASFLCREPAPVTAGALAGTVLIVAKHHENIRRLISGTERKFALGKGS
jgi:glycerol-3-phosphate acyltransferase PlsY